MDRPLDCPPADSSFEITSGPRIRCPFLTGISWRLTDGPERRLGPTAMWRGNQGDLVQYPAGGPGHPAGI